MGSQIQDDRRMPVVPRLEIQQDAPILSSDKYHEIESDKIEHPGQSRTARTAKAHKRLPTQIIRDGGRRQTVSNMLNGAPVEDSHPDCDFCASQFDLLDQSQCLIMKKKMLRQSSGASRDKEEEFFRMCLLSYQLANKRNQKILALDSRSLYEEAAKRRKLPFFKWNDWLRKKVEML